MFDLGIWANAGSGAPEARRRLGQTEIEAVVREGTLRDALLHAARANRKHGLRRNDADNLKMIIGVLTDKYGMYRGVRAIAREFGVSHTFVSKCRKKLESDNQLAQSDPALDTANSSGCETKAQPPAGASVSGHQINPEKIRSVMRNGHWYPMRTKNIGRSPRKAKAPKSGVI